ncbi:hypothetical protein C7380_10493 [Oceanotoga teriensis]|uniref:Uncharacterized protein n=1 Tax=Oceanotoga teriensis TaxID=515440 RepID=A0AA45HJ35_9BACT|nr:hypothetical protein C7380_10493 [Oceanotoga teriensis]
MNKKVQVISRPINISGDKKDKVEPGNGNCFGC